jgi:hypothetical protein
MNAGTSCTGPVAVSRRRVLQAGGIGLLGLSLPRVLHAEARLRQTGGRRVADACILVFLNGGPSHLDMWDMKPDAPKEIRGEFRPIATTVPGVRLCEHLPRLARWMHHCALVRSVRHGVNNAHAAAVYVGLTGHDRGDATASTVRSSSSPGGRRSGNCWRETGERGPRPSFGERSRFSDATPSRQRDPDASAKRR